MTWRLAAFYDRLRKGRTEPAPVVLNIGGGDVTPEFTAAFKNAWATYSTGTPPPGHAQEYKPVSPLPEPPAQPPAGTKP